MDDIYIEPDPGEETYLEMNDHEGIIENCYKYKIPTYLYDIKVRIIGYEKLEPLMYRLGNRARIRIVRIK